MPLQVLVLLILCNTVWSVSPVMGKIAMEDFSSSHAAVLRYAVAFLSYLLLIPVLRRRTGLRGQLVIPLGDFRAWSLLALLGFLTFCFSPLLQFRGLDASRAVDTSLIVAMEPLITVLLAAIVVRERVRPVQALCFLLALCGFWFLSGLTVERLRSGWDAHFWGNILVLVSLTGDASYSVIARKLLPRVGPFGIFAAGLGFGVLFLGVVTTPGVGLPDLGQLTWRSAGALIWLGGLGTTVTYLYWLIALSQASIPGLALTLFIQPVLGAVWGYAMLGELLTPVQSAGGLLILLAVLLQSLLQRDPVGSENACCRLLSRIHQGRPGS